MDKKIREVCVFSEGDSNDVSVWSNIPYFFTKSLEENGIKVNRINIKVDNKLRNFYNDFLVRKFIQKYFKNNWYDFSRSFLCRIIVERRIWNATKLYPQTDIFIFLSFSFYNRFTNKPSIQLCDWTYQILVNQRKFRKFNFLEYLYIKGENSAIENSFMVISLFPECTQTMQNTYKNTNIFYLGTNVINNYNKFDIEKLDIIKIKEENSIILFIGNKQYMEGAILLLNAFINMFNHHNNNSNWELHYIGLESKDFNQELPNNITCHGYLHKNIEDECQVYYDLLIRARVFVNPTPIWGGYSSTIEAMFYYNPIVISPYIDFLKEFGTDIGFGQYLKNSDIQSLEDALNNVLLSKDYRKSCLCAHETVKNYTWPNFISRFLNKYDSLI